MLYFRVVIFLLLPLLSANVYAVEMGNVMQFRDKLVPPEQKVGVKSEYIDTLDNIRKLSQERPTLGIGYYNIMILVDFNSPMSLRQLDYLIDVARKDLKLRLTIIYYSPAVPIHDQAAAVFSMAVYRHSTPKQHIRYLKYMIKNYGREKNSIVKAVNYANIPLRSLLASASVNSKKLNELIEENNVLGYKITRLSKTPILIMNNKIITQFLNKKQARAVISYAFNYKRNSYLK